MGAVGLCSGMWCCRGHFGSHARGCLRVTHLGSACLGHSDAHELEWRWTSPPHQSCITSQETRWISADSRWKRTEEKKVKNPSFGNVIRNNVSELMLNLFPGFSSLSFFPPLCWLPGQTCGFGRLHLRQCCGEQPGWLQEWGWLERAPSHHHWGTATQLWGCQPLSRTRWCFLDMTETKLDEV